MLSFVTVYLFLGIFIHAFISIRSEELAVVPNSIFTDPNLYRFCWIQIGTMDKKYIEGYDVKSKNKTEKFEIFPDEENGKNTYCIERKNNDVYKINLIMTRFTDKPQLIPFTVQFNCPLTPGIEFIKFATLQRGIIFELHSEFAGLSSSVSPICYILLVSQLNNLKTFYKLKMTAQLDRLFQPISANSVFTFYYTCNMGPPFLTSTRFVIKSGTMMSDDINRQLHQIMQMPMRRFLKLVWKHPKYVPKRYDVAIYRITENNVYVCIKIFRIYVHIMQNEIKLAKQLAKNCNRDVPVEDMGNFNNGGDGWISVILDMISPLKMYGKYKLSIFWADSFNTVSENYVHFTPLPNENCAYVNNNFFKYKVLNYDEIINSTSSMLQTIICKVQKNPFKDNKINRFSYSTIEILSGISVKNENTILRDIEYNVSFLFATCKQSGCSKNFFPYFYAFYSVSSNLGNYMEIVQIPIPQDGNATVENFKLLPYHKEMIFIVSWKITNSPYMTAPAMFLVEIINAETELCQSAYLIKCRTCNKIYMKDTQQSGKEKISLSQKHCLTTKELNGHYDATDSSISIRTDKMSSFINFKASISSFKFTSVYKYESIKYEFLRESFWQKNGSAIIAVICTLCVIGLLVALFFGYRSLTKEPSTKEIFSSEKKDCDEEIYDEEI